MRDLGPCRGLVRSGRYRTRGQVHSATHTLVAMSCDGSSTAWSRAEFTCPNGAINHLGVRRGYPGLGSKVRNGEAAMLGTVVALVRASAARREADGGEYQDRKRPLRGTKLPAESRGRNALIGSTDCQGSAGGLPSLVAKPIRSARGQVPKFQGPADASRSLVVRGHR